MKFHIWIFFLENILRKFLSYQNMTRITGTLHEDLCTFVIISHSPLLSMRNLWDTTCRAIQNITFYFRQRFFFRNSCCSWENVEIYCEVGQATDNNTTHAHCMLDTQVYKHAVRIYNTYCITTPKMVARTHLKVTLYVFCLSYKNSTLF
jgi:hypothetical protein